MRDLRPISEKYYFIMRIKETYLVENMCEVRPSKGILVISYDERSDKL